MTDGLSTLYQDLLGGSYDCVDRIVLNAYFRMGHDPGGFRVWWRALTGSDETLENTYLMRLAGQYNFYISDQYWGRMFVRMCPYLPFSARVCLNQHHWLANRMREEGIDFQQCSNAFLRCGAPERLQQLADTLTAEDLGSR